MAPIELDDYGPPPTSSSIISTGQGDDPSSDPLLPSTSANNTHTRHTRFALPQPGDPHYHRTQGDDDDADDNEFHDVPDSDSPAPRNWRPASGRRNRNRSSSNPTSFFPKNTRKFPLLLVGLIGVPVLLLSLIYGIIRGNAPELLPDLHLPEIIYGGKTDNFKSLAERCICGSGEGGKERTEGERVCEVYGKEGLGWSRLHEGTGNRIKGFVEQAKTGRKLKVGILGGSGEPRMSSIVVSSSSSANHT